MTNGNKNRFSSPKFLMELVLFLWVEYFFYFREIDFFYIRLEIFAGLFTVWLFFSLLTKRFNHFDYSQNYWKSLNSSIKFYILFIFSSIFIFILLKNQIPHPKLYFLSASTYVIWSFIIESYIYFSYKPYNSDEVNLKLIKATTYPEIKELRKVERNFPFLKKSKEEEASNFSNSIKEDYFSECPALFDFIDENINLNYFADKNFKIIRSSDPYNVKVLKNRTTDLFVNLHELNDLRRINEYLILLNSKLTENGVFIGKFEPIRKRYKRFLEKYPLTLAYVFYFFDFLWKRVSPKLPIIQKFYFAVTKGKDRALSLAEGLGRLYFSGYEVISLKEVENFVFFIAVRVKEPSTNKNPSYGPLFKMKRIGKSGDIIYVYKLRTMHPYSEYLQDYILQNFGYNEIGKPANDFRVTKWGKIARKFWLDELPQLINVAKGEMKLVGVRPLSERFLKEYPQEIKEMRFKYKPGCIPPYVAMLKQDVNEYIESEKIYLKEKEKHPYFTDVKIFFIALYNIFTNKIRSA